jgi:DNA (cytosine-5)-methyltransferase 1
VAAGEALSVVVRAISLCAGVGGLDLGVHRALARAGLETRTVCYVEREAYAAGVLVQRMEEGQVDPAPVWSDLVAFDARRWRGAVDLLVGGYPCQPFSVAGKQRAQADERHLWPHVARIARECEPRFVCFENVANHLRLGADEVLGELQAMGYRTAGTLWTAQEVGAPHRRERLFLLGVRD